MPNSYQWAPEKMSGDPSSTSVRYMRVVAGGALTGTTAVDAV